MKNEKLKQEQPKKKFTQTTITFYFICPNQIYKFKNIKNEIKLKNKFFFCALNRFEWMDVLLFKEIFPIKNQHIKLINYPPKHHFDLFVIAFPA